MKVLAVFFLILVTLVVHQFQLFIISSTSVVVYGDRDDDQQSTQLRYRERTDKKYFILHIGPMKTGTTSIQCSLRKLDEDGVLRDHNSTLLEMRKRVVERVGEFEWLPGCWLQWKNGSMPSCWKKSYEPFLSKSKINTVIISNEELMKVFSQFRENSNDFLRDLSNSLQVAGDYHLVVIATYRRFFEWVVSVHHERNDVMDSRKPAHRKWPGKDGGIKIRSVYHMLMDITSRKQNIQSHLYPNQHVKRAVQFFSDHDNVSFRLINMHHGDLENNFFCQGLPDEIELRKYLCKLTKTTNRNLTCSKKNQAIDSLWYDALAIAAYRKGLLPTKSLRRDVIKSIANFQRKLNETKTSFAKLCPLNFTYEALLNESLQQEELLIPYLHEQDTGEDKQMLLKKWELEHRKAFEKYVGRYKFCTIDVKTVLKDPKWIDFFKHYNLK